MKLWTRLDLVLRVLVCIVLVPGLVQARQVVPMTGILINVALALIGVLATEWLGRFTYLPLIGKTVRRLQRIPAYYAEHPPRNIFYYLFYPFLFPYWLFVKKARRELGFYRSFGVMTVVVLVGTGAFEYLRHWYPHLPFSRFAGAEVGLFIVQMLVTMVMVMPVVTTAVLLRGRWKTLIAVGVVAGLSIASSLLFGKPHASVMATTRIRERTRYQPLEVGGALHAALAAAWQDTAADAPAGRLGGKALDDAHAALARAYDRDEVAAFRLWLDGDGVLMVYVPDTRGRPTWLAMTRDGQIVTQSVQLDARALDALVQQP